MADPRNSMLFYFQLRDKVDELQKDLKDDTLRPDVRQKKEDHIEMYLAMMQEANNEYFKGMNQLN